MSQTQTQPGMMDGSSVTQPTNEEACNHHQVGSTLDRNPTLSHYKGRAFEPGLFVIIRPASCLVGSCCQTFFGVSR